MTTDDAPDHYAILGVPRTATATEIARAYHGLVRRYHPDTAETGPHSGRFQDVITAYTVLRDPARRADYDQRHPATPPPGPRHRPAPAPPRPPAHPAPAEPLIRAGPVRWQPLPPPGHGRT